MGLENIWQSKRDCVGPAEETMICKEFSIKSDKKIVVCGKSLSRCVD